MIAKKYEALYFPYTKCFDDVALKRALLYFDRIHFMDPFNLEELESLIDTSHYFDGVSWDEGSWYLARIKDTYKFLQDKGAIVNADIYPLILKYDKELTANTQADISDTTFCNYSYGDIDVNEEKVSWHILERRFPPSLLPSMKKADWKSFRREIAKSGVSYTDLKYGGKFLSFKEEFDKFLPKRSALRKHLKYTNVYIPASEAPQYDRYGLSNSESLHKDFPNGYIIPYAYGASISISQAMLYGAMNNLTLFTDSETMHYLLARKCQIAFEGSNIVAGKLHSFTSMLQNIKENDLIISAIDAIIPKKLLEKMSIAETMKLRKASSSQLNEFRSYISELSVIKSAPWEKSYYQEIQELTTKIEVEVKRLQLELSATYQKIFRSALQSLGGVGLGIAIMPHNLTIGSVIALLAAKDIPLDPIFKTWEARVNYKQHCLSYLINIDRSAKKTQKSSSYQKPWDSESGRVIL